MKWYLPLIVTISLQLAVCPSKAEDETIQTVSENTVMPQDPLQLLQAGMNWFNSKEYQKAYDTFVAGVEKDPQNISFYLNAGLAAMKLGKKGLSLAYIRSAYSLDPNSKDTLRILQQATEDARIVQIPRQILFIENATQFARNFPLWLCILVSLGTLGLLIYRLWSWLPAWKQARLTGESISLNSLNYFVFLGFSVFFSLCLLQFYDRSLSRGTVIAGKSEVRTLPENTAAVLIEFYEGFEVLVKETQTVMDPQSQTPTEWLKIQYPGSFQGWVKADDVMITSLTSANKNR